LPELDGLLAWVACIGDAQPLERYAELLLEGGFTILGSTLRDGSLRAMVEGVRKKLLLADVMIGLKKLELPGLDVRAAKAFADAADRAVHNKQLGYALLVAEARSV
jgi:arsenite methyltransferase